MPSTVTRMINKLNDDELISQGNTKSKKVIYLTKKGTDMMSELLDMWKNYHLAI